MSEVYTVKNRTSQTITGTWGGRQYDLAPNGTGAFPALVATAMKRQNPIMGSGDPRDSEYGMTGRMKYKVGIVELGDPVDSVEINPTAVERWDRSKLVGAKPSEVVAGDNGIYSGRDVAGRLSPSIIPQLTKE